MIKERISLLASQLEADNIVPAVDLLALAKNVSRQPPEMIHEFLELAHFRSANRVFHNSPYQKQWIALITDLITSSGYHLGVCFEQRAERYGDKPLMQWINGEKITHLTYSQAWQQVQNIAGSLKADDKTKTPVVGIFTPNCVHGALVDLACLSFDLRDVPVPLTLSPEHFRFVLEQAGITHLFLGGIDQITMVEHLGNNANLPEIILFPGFTTEVFQYTPWDLFLSRCRTLPQRSEVHPQMDGIASIMYTSGTTADPKGIIFSQKNIMCKRFCRPLALPEISARDVFLSYLPLFHTFGRFLELAGSLYLGATYTFAESPAFRSLLKDFKQIKPSVFISIPKRWNQLYNYILDNMESKDHDPLREMIEQITGGQLKWGLSAAGYLDPSVFRFFQAHGIQLLSGYGMTEATGGILMTPPGDYSDDSVGKPLPGIETRLNDDGELLLRGCYVSSGYYPESPPGTFQDGWFHTGDIFKMKKGHYFIIDRKKEIYKNSRGQTISPQKIENMFLDFDSVKSVFLVGDGQEYNTLLIYPDLQNIPEESQTDLQAWFTPLVQSVNTFLAPYERIVQYTIINRDFNREQGELTSKGTFKRKAILKNFDAMIKPMYRRNFVSCFHGEYEIRIPNWLMREWGITRSDIDWDGNHLRINKDNKSLRLTCTSGTVFLGSYPYLLDYPVIDLDALLKRPELWVGNEQLIAIIGNAAFRNTNDIPDCNLSLDGENIFKHVEAIQKSALITQGAKSKSVSLQTIHYSALALHAAERETVSLALDQLKHLLSQSNGTRDVIIRVIKRLRSYPAPEFRFRALEILLPYLGGEEFVNQLHDSFIYARHKSKEANVHFNIKELNKNHFYAIIQYLKRQKKNLKTISQQDYDFIRLLLNNIASYCALHPSSFLEGRSELNWWRRFCVVSEIAQHANQHLDQLIHSFRNWLGSNVQVSIDPETDQEYGWQDVIEFDTNVSPEMRLILTKGLATTCLLRESIFIFSHNRLIELNDIPLKGIWVTKLGEGHGKLVYRVLVQTRHNESFNLVINYSKSLSKAFLEDEIQWLMVMSSREAGRKLVEDFGGYWPEYAMYTEEYIPGETLSQYLARNRKEINAGTRMDRWQMRWLHFIWNGCMAYIDFWYRTGNTYAIANPSPSNLIIPEYDYTSGTRLISISNRIENTKLAPLLFSLWKNFVLATEEQYPGLRRMADWEVLFTAMLQVVSVKSGLELLDQLKEEIKGNTYRKEVQSYGLTAQRIDNFISEINEYGVLTKQVTFAALRYNRWLELNPEATQEARGRILLELYKDYRLSDLIDHYPETRIRFFLMTCFKDSNPELRDVLTQLQKKVRSGEISLKEMDQNIRTILEKMDINTEDEYFLTRLLFEHIQAQDFGELVSWDFGQQGRLDLITTITDNNGEYYRVRSAFHPREIAGFYAILSRANMPSPFHQDHQFLLVLDANNTVIGGIYWKDIGESTAYLERIVIRRDFQKKGLSTKLLNEFFQRLKHVNYRYVTVGFFQAGLFYKHGFTINKQFGGLVKTL